MLTAGSSFDVCDVLSSDDDCEVNCLDCMSGAAGEGVVRPLEGLPSDDVQTASQMLVSEPVLEEFIDTGLDVTSAVTMASEGQDLSNMSTVTVVLASAGAPPAPEIDRLPEALQPEGEGIMSADAFSGVPTMNLGNMAYRRRRSSYDEDMGTPPPNVPPPPCNEGDDMDDSQDDVVCLGDLISRHPSMAEHFGQLEANLSRLCNCLEGVTIHQASVHETLVEDVAPMREMPVMEDLVSAGILPGNSAPASEVAAAVQDRMREVVCNVLAVQHIISPHTTRLWTQEVATDSNAPADVCLNGDGDPSGAAGGHTAAWSNLLTGSAITFIAHFLAFVQYTGPFLLRCKKFLTS